MHTKKVVLDAFITISSLIIYTFYRCFTTDNSYFLFFHPVSQQAIARAITHPIRVHQRNRLTTSTAASCLALRFKATILGKK